MRDGLLGIKTYDVDISTTMLPEEVEKQFNNICNIGKRFGTIMIFSYPWTIEITTTRKDINPDGRHTDVIFTNNFIEDSDRRDFTINGLYLYNEITYEY